MSNPITLTREQAALVLAYAVARRACLDLRFAARMLRDSRKIRRIARHMGMTDREVLWGTAILVADSLGYLAYGPFEHLGWAEDLVPLAQSHVLREPFRFLAHYEPDYVVPYGCYAWCAIHRAGEADRDYMARWDAQGNQRQQRMALLALLHRVLRRLPPLPNYHENEDLLEPRLPNRKSPRHPRSARF